MYIPGIPLQVESTRTLWFNLFRSQVKHISGDYVGMIRFMPIMPLDRNTVPADAPEVKPYLLVIVDDAQIMPDQLVPFESELSDKLMKLLSNDEFQPEYCQMVYPNAPHLLKEENSPTL